MNRLAQKDLPEGVLAYTYWPDNHVQTIKAYRRSAVAVNGAVTNGTTPDVSLGYGYDYLGRLAGVTNNTLVPTDVTASTQAARVYRLTSENFYNYQDTYDGDMSYAYDAVGNRTNRIVDLGFTPMDALANQSFHFDRRDQIDSDAVPNNANTNYDANGNTLVTNGVPTGDLYDAENRLVSAQSWVGPVKLQYDEKGNRVSEAVGGGTMHYLVDEQNPTGYAQVVAEYTSLSNAPNVTYAWGTSLISEKPISGNVIYYGYDGQGNVRLLLDNTSAANVVVTYDYDGYGNMLASSSGGPNNNYRYTGQQWDAYLGMYYLRARYYKPDLGRFWTGDTYEAGQTDPLALHKYLYVEDNPVNGTDPSGHAGVFNFTDKFGNRAHAAIESAYQAEHPGAIVGPTTGVLGTSLKPDIFDGISRTYMEIKPLSLSGVAKGVFQIGVYSATFNAFNLGYSRGTWPNGVRSTYVGLDPIAYFNVQGIIFYTDMTDNLDDLATISTVALARQFIIQNSALLTRTLSGIMVRIPGLAVSAQVSDNARLGAMEGIATLDSLMGAP